MHFFGETNQIQFPISIYVITVGSSLEQIKERESQLPQMLYSR